MPSVAASLPPSARVTASVDDALPPHGQRDPLIDGFRGVAVLAVVASHAINFRYVGDGTAMAALSVVTMPAAALGVQLFFVISGYIITTLLLLEEARAGSISLRGFYIRRTLRILPPFAAMLAGTYALQAGGLIAPLPAASWLSAATFTCNTGLVTCNWFVAHSWSLAVEEQYYLVWPMLMLMIAPRRRLPVLLAILALLAALFFARPFVWQSNAASFACIGVGAAYALSPQLRRWIAVAARWWLWLAVVAMLVGAQHWLASGGGEALSPLALCYVLFAPRSMPAIARLIGSRPLVWVGGLSYSLYLWQQMFLGSPANYANGGLWTVLLLPVAWASARYIEQPGIAAARRLSQGQRPASTI